MIGGLLGVALAGTPVDVSLVESRMAEIAPLRAKRLTTDAPALPSDALGKVASGQVVTTLASVPGHKAKKALGLAVVDVPIGRLWAAVNDESSKVEWTRLGYLEVLEGEDGAKAGGEWPAFHKSTAHASPLVHDSGADAHILLPTYDGEVLFFDGAVPHDLEESLIEQIENLDLDGLLEVFILNDLDNMADGSQRVIDIDEVKALRITPGWDLRNAVSERPALLTVPSPFDHEPRIHVTEVDGNGRSDVVLVGQTRDGVRTIQLLVF